MQERLFATLICAKSTQGIPYYRSLMPDYHYQDLLHDFAEIAVETFFADIFVIERRQHQHACATVSDGLLGKLDRFHDRTATGSRHHLRSAAGATADEYRARGKEVWDDALHRVRSFQDDSKQYVRANPTKAVFTGLGVGFVLGLVFRR
jgi:ElaB/YqjD/DUF883 family membrane-anchored ribosome-binding protein